MQVLTRKLGERILIDGDIQIVVVSIQEGEVRLGIVAPAFVPVLPQGLLNRGLEQPTRRDDLPGGPGP